MNTDYFMTIDKMVELSAEILTIIASQKQTRKQDISNLLIEHKELENDFLRRKRDAL